MSQTTASTAHALLQKSTERDDMKRTPRSVREKVIHRNKTAKADMGQFAAEEPEWFLRGLKIVERYARKFSFKSSSASDLREELFSVGSIALVESFSRYESFSEEHRTRALSLRIRGEMLDYIARGQKSRETVELIEESASGSKRTDPEYRHTLSNIRGKLERGFEELTLQEHAVLKNFLTGQIPELIKETSASNRTKIKQKAFKKLRKYVSLHFDMKELLDFIAD